MAGEIIETLYKFEEAAKQLKLNNLKAWNSFPSEYQFFTVGCNKLTLAKDASDTELTVLNLGVWGKIHNTEYAILDWISKCDKSPKWRVVGSSTGEFDDYSSSLFNSYEEAEEELKLTEVLYTYIEEITSY